jgi:hypothetical protein
MCIGGIIFDSSKVPILCPDNSMLLLSNAETTAANGRPIAPRTAATCEPTTAGATTPTTTSTTTSSPNTETKELGDGVSGTAYVVT